MEFRLKQLRRGRGFLIANSYGTMTTGDATTVGSTVVYGGSSVIGATSPVWSPMAM